MAYAFRWKLTSKDPIRIEKPDDYDPRRYEIFCRGLQRGIFDDTNGWPHQLYVREARRMKSSCIVTQ
jgi:hypothetical protein